MKKMKETIANNESLKFVAKTIFYFAIIILLIYLYSYSRTGGVHFIYNEF